MTGDFGTLLEEFNRSAVEVRKIGVNPSLLVTKFSLIMNFSAKTPEEREQLTGSMFKNTLDWLHRIASPDYNGDIASAATRFKGFFEALATPNSIKFLPETAADDLAEVSLRLTRKGEGATQQSFELYSLYLAYQIGYSDLANLTLDYAMQFKTAIQERNMDVSTARPVTASRPITLKTPAAAT